MSTFTNFTNIKFDTSWMSKRGSSSRDLGYTGVSVVPVEPIGDSVRCSDTKGFMEIPISQVKDIQELAKGFLLGALFQQRLKIDDVVFYPCPTIELANQKGEPVYIHVTENTFQLETWFQKKDVYFEKLEQFGKVDQ
ncbi:hypothetical protein 2018Mat004_0940 [Vibrio phage ICP1]|nr:hypothetical protein ICP12017FMathbaria_192 [Vibrio phage ICP1_2017_F_Mathbaria]QVW04237.1 hypothetical protein 2017MatI_0975 [Vibrio phage ICP1]QVW04464.1 hypothetical protein 2017MatK_0980 [Vibrio phage ICP1]QVW04688.1 hypothetical protein 2018Mat001_0960 [Vibrio phage ICP1]QVW05131.1 hypothetical protein 2018Mat004_0940 [Vibrio phage ICP1]